MRTSFVLRLDPVYLAVGQVHGEVEEVGTGQRAVLRSWDDLVDFCVPRADPDGPASVRPFTRHNLEHGGG